MRVWTTRWNGKDGYEWDLIGPDSELPVGGLWSDGLTSPHIKFIVDACNAAEQRAQDAADVAGTPVYCAESDAFRLPTRTYSVIKDGKVVREVTVFAGDSVPLAPGESLAPVASEVGDQWVYGPLTTKISGFS